MAKPDFRAAAARRLAQDRELSPSILSLLAPEGTARRANVRNIPLDRIESNPDQPRLSFDEDALNELAASLKEHGVLQPILVRPRNGRYQLVAGERRWRAAGIASLPDIPALVEELDDDTALEISIIENLQREDLSPLDEALMFERMTQEHGYSVRRLATKLGKDKGYIENRLRLADAPPEVKQLVSLRKDTLSHAYELMKIDDPKKRRRLAEQVARGELSLVKLRERVEGPAIRHRPQRTEIEQESEEPAHAASPPVPMEPRTVGDDSLLLAKGHLTDALDELVDVLAAPSVRGQIVDVDRANLAKYLRIASLKLENAIALLRSEEPNNPRFDI